MNEELKKYVQAYIDGEDVEYQYAPANVVRNYEWYKVDGFSVFDTDGFSKEDYLFRIKPKAEDKWQRVIDEGCLCKFWDEGHKIHYFSRLLEMDDKFRDANGTGWYNCEVLREKGIKQPYFQGDDIPKIDGDVVVYWKDGTHTYTSYCARGDWSEVVAYIEVQR